ARRPPPSRPPPPSPGPSRCRHCDGRGGRWLTRSCHPTRSRPAPTFPGADRMDGFDAALRQLAEHGERLAVLDQREAEHFRAIGGRLAELGSLVTGLGSTLRDQAAALAHLQGVDGRVADLTIRLAAIL